MENAAAIIASEQTNTLVCQGRWVVENISQLRSSIKKILKSKHIYMHVDAEGLDALDSSGAVILNQLLRSVSGAVQVRGLSEKHEDLLDIVSEKLALANELKEPSKFNLFHKLGESAVDKFFQLRDFISFVGEIVVLAVHGVFRPRHIPWRDLVKVIDDCGFRALGIVGLMMFLIGVVTAYQLAVQLRQYGANIFIVDTSGIAVLREFAPLITAVIVAGRTSTAFSALIGTMIVNEEIDALRTMGVQPVLRLVLPRIAGLLITLPLLTVWADIWGIIGSMIMSKSVLNIDYPAYFARFNQAVGLTHYILGMIKTPIFAIVIASVGCFQGFAVKSSAESVGKQTTKAAVQAIFMIIVVDAIFSIIFSMLGL